MPNANVRKGRDAEQAVMKLAQAMGIPAIEGRKAGRRDDQGDIWLWPTGEGARVVIQVKNESSKIRKNVGMPSWTDIQKYWKATEDQAARVPNCDVSLLAVKRPGKGNAADWFAWASVGDLLPWEMGCTALYHGGPPDVPGMWPLGALLAYLHRFGCYLDGGRRHE